MLSYLSLKLSSRLVFILELFSRVLHVTPTPRECRNLIFHIVMTVWGLLLGNGLNLISHTVLTVWGPLLRNGLNLTFHSVWRCEARSKGMISISHFYTIMMVWGPLLGNSLNLVFHTLWQCEARLRNVLNLIFHIVW